MCGVVSLRAVDAVGTALCVASEDGEKLYERIVNALQDGRRVEVSFERVEVLTSAFLNSSIGQLYGRYEEDFLRANVIITNLLEDDRILLQRVVITAKAYFSDPDRFNGVKHDALEDYDESR